MWKIIMVMLALMIVIQWKQYYKGPMHRLTALGGAHLLLSIPVVSVSIQKDRIQKIPNSWQYIPFLHSTMASSLAPLSPFVYVPIPMFTEIQAGTPSLETKAVLYHEFTHYQRYKNQSIWHAAKYIVSRKHRVFEELCAIRTEMAFRKQHGLAYDIDRKARHFAGPAYLWTASYNTAKQVLATMWQSI